MSTIKLDISEVIAVTKAAVRSLERTQPEGMKRILDKAAAEERRTHAYRNRTWHLQQSTFAAELVEAPNQFSVEFGARTHYASYVDNRGLTRVRELADRCANEIDFFFDGEADRLGSM